MRIIFMGTPDFGVPTLKALVKAGHDIVGVYTRAPKTPEQGAHQQISAIHQAALDMGLPVFTPANFKNQADIDQFKALNADLAIVAAYGLILPQAILDAPKKGCWNIHGSDLPRWRGAAPIQRSIQAGDTTTRLSLQQMNAGLDTGDILLKSAPVTITPTMTTGELHDIFSQQLAPQLVLDAIKNNPTPIPQPEKGIIYAPKITKDEMFLDFGLSPENLSRFIRAMSPFPGAFCQIQNPFHPDEMIRLKVYDSEIIPDIHTTPEQHGTILNKDFAVATGFGAVRFKTIQQAGRRKQPAAVFLNGMPLVGKKLVGRQTPSLHFLLNQDSPITYDIEKDLAAQQKQRAQNKKKINPKQSVRTILTQHNIENTRTTSEVDTTSQRIDRSR